MDLKERMFLTVSGQVTWADPSLKKNCWDCKHVQRHPKSRGFKRHQCQLVRAHTGRDGQPFNAEKAISCSKFEDDTSL